MVCLCRSIFFIFMKKRATNNNIVLTVFKRALTIGNPETSNNPFIPSGLGPNMRNTIARVITMEIMYMILSQKASLTNFGEFKKESAQSKSIIKVMANKQWMPTLDVEHFSYLYS